MDEERRFNVTPAIAKLINMQTQMQIDLAEIKVYLKQTEEKHALACGFHNERVQTLEKHAFGNGHEGWITLIPKISDHMARQVWYFRGIFTALATLIAGAIKEIWFK